MQIKKDANLANNLMTTLKLANLCDDEGEAYAEWELKFLLDDLLDDISQAHEDTIDDVSDAIRDILDNEREDKE